MQRNAAAAEELSATSEELAAQAVALRDMMAFFNLREDEQPTAAARDIAGPPPARLTTGGVRNAPIEMDEGFRRF